MSYTAELIAVGTELLLGEIANTDAQFLSRELSALGISVYHHTVVGDNPQRLRAAVELARQRADLIITTGGLGPTCDDLTKNTLAECFGLEMVHDQKAEDNCRAYFEKLGREMTANNKQQFYLPEGCTPFQNAWGTAPGCAFEADGVTVLMLPGPPRECQAMFRHRAVPYLERFSQGAIVSRALRFFGIGESSLENQLRDQMNSMTNPTLAPYAKEGEVELRLTASAPTAEEARALLEPVEADLRAQFGDLIYGADVDSLEEVVLDLMKEQGLTLAAAESCTGGLVAQRFTALPGSSAVFRGGVVSYATEVKHDLLGVPQEMLDEFGAVSDPVARAMAEGARAALKADLAMSVTGVAGPDPDERNNPVGLVFVALATPKGTFVRKLTSAMSRQRIRTSAASTAFDLLRRYLTGLDLKAE